MPQLQLLMDILDLDEAVFIQYKPYDLTWPAPEEFMVTRVPRDPEWMNVNLPKMEALWNKVLWHREHGVDSLLNPEKPKRVYAPRKKKQEFPVEMLIANISDDKYEDD